MPNDSTLYPSIPSAQQQLVQRQGSLEARVAALEGKRDSVFTPYSTLPGPATQIPWYGGRIWASCGGWVSWTTPPAAGYYALRAALSLNGIPISAFSNPVYGYTPAANQPLIMAIPAMSVEFSAATMATLGAVPGQVLSLTVVPELSATNCRMSGIFIEWPQA